MPHNKTIKKISAKISKIRKEVKPQKKAVAGRSKNKSRKA